MGCGAIHTGRTRQAFYRKTRRSMDFPITRSESDWFRQNSKNVWLGQRTCLESRCSIFFVVGCDQPFTSVGFPKHNAVKSLQFIAFHMQSRSIERDYAPGFESNAPA